MMLEYLFLGTIILLPLQFALNVGESIDLVAIRVIVPVVFLAWLIRGLARKKIWIPNRPETWLLFLLLFLSGISLAGGLGWEKGVRKFLYLLSVFPIYFVAANLLKDEKFQAKALWSVWAGGFLAAATGLVQFLLPFVIGLDATLKIWKNMAGFFWGGSFGRLVAENPSWLVNVSGATWMRAFGFFPDPHVFSFFVSLCFFVGMGLLFSAKRTFGKILVGIGNFLMFLAIIFSFSRGAYLGFAAGIILFFIFFLKRKNILEKVAVFGVIVVIAIFALYQQVIFQRLASTFNLQEGSNAERIKNWQQAVDIVENYPLSGIGLGNYSSFIDPMSGERSSIYAHNIFLDIASETGVVNGIVFLLIIAIGIWRGILSKSMVGLWIASGLFYFLVHGIFDTPIWSPQVMVILLVIMALNLRLKDVQQQI